MLDLFSIHFRRRGQRKWHNFIEFCGGCTKPLFGAPDLKFHQFRQAWYQIKAN